MRKNNHNGMDLSDSEKDDNADDVDDINFISYLDEDESTVDPVDLDNLVEEYNGQQYMYNEHLSDQYNEKLKSITQEFNSNDRELYFNSTMLKFLRSSNDYIMTVITELIEFLKMVLPRYEDRSVVSNMNVIKKKTTTKQTTKYVKKTTRKNKKDSNLKLPFKVHPRIQKDSNVDNGFNVIRKKYKFNPRLRRVHIIKYLRDIKTNSIGKLCKTLTKNESIDQYNAILDFCTDIEYVIELLEGYDKQLLKEEPVVKVMELVNDLIESYKNEFKRDK